MIAGYRWPKKHEAHGPPKALIFGPTRARAQHDNFGPGPARARCWAVLGCNLKVHLGPQLFW
jgi:hypothetical protein